MPEIMRVLSFLEVDPFEFYNRCVEAFQRVGGEITDAGVESQSPFAAEISAFVPSIWGWGGMRFRAKLGKSGEACTLQLSGYIAQLATGPLSKKMDEFTAELAQQPGRQSLGPVPEPVAPQDRKWKGADTTMVLLVVVGVAGLLLLSTVLRVPSVILALVAIPVTYYLARSLLKK